MKKILAIAVMVLIIGINLNVMAQPLRYTPIVKQATYTTQQTGTLMWEPSGHGYDCIAMTGYTISSDCSQKGVAYPEAVTIAASDPIVTIYPASPETVNNPPGFLWKGAAGEAITVTTSSVDPGTVSITLMGYETIN